MTTHRAGLVVVLALALVLGGCIAVDGPGTIEVHVLVTRDVGTVVLHDAWVELPNGSTALDAARAVATVETAYGGGFVVAIDGLSSRYPDEALDWFYHVDGALQPLGAAERALDDRDVVLWDHRPWNRSMALSFVLTGTTLAPSTASLAEPAGPQGLDGLASGERFLRVDGEDLVVLDAWGVAARSLPPPWLAVHATTTDDGAPSYIVAASGPDALPLADAFDGWSPSGVGAVATPDGLVGVPA